MLKLINSGILGIAVPVTLLCGGAFFSVMLARILWRRPFAVLAPFFRREIKTGGDTVSPRRALWMALGGVLGVGNIVGVSAAIYFGGAGAVFWMCVSAILAASLKYAETLLALICRRKCGSGTTADYINAALSERGKPRAGAFLSSLFAILCLCNSLCMGCVIQVNAVAGVCEAVLGIKPLAVGVVAAGLTVLVATGGLRRISAATAAIVPFMSCAFCLLSFTVLIIRADAVGDAIKEIFSSAFSFEPRGILGGIGGFFLSRALRFGVMRGLISNEAGAGTSPMAHSSSSAAPVEQGFLGIVEVLIDTVFLCTLTALVILVSFPEVAVFGENSVMMTVSAYSTVLGGWADYAMCALVMLFGLATLFCQSFYGLSCLHKLSRSPLAKITLYTAYAAAALAGAGAPPGAVWELADLSIGLMTLINVFVLFLERRKILRESADYFQYPGFIILP